MGHKDKEIKPKKDKYRPVNRDCKRKVNGGEKSKEGL